MPNGLSKTLILLWLFFGIAASQATPAGVYAEARTLAAERRRPEALTLLEQHLALHPADVDARLLYGIVLSWEHRYDESRAALQTVLAGHPAYPDASLALANVELWSGHAPEAERVTEAALAERPGYAPLLVLRARVLRALKRGREALADLDRVIEADPENAEAVDLHRAIKDEEKPWQTALGQSYTRFSDGSSSWHEQTFTLRRGTNAGSLLFRLNRGSRFGLSSNQIESDWYPSLRPGTYMYLNLGYSPDTNLYPGWRTGAELFQNIGRGFEASGGMRRLMFKTTTIDVYTGSAGRYYKDWYGSARLFITPDTPGASRSWQLQARRYFGDRERWLNFRYGRGSSPFEVRSLNEVGVLQSTSFAGEVNWLFAGHGILNFTAGAAQEDRIARAGVWQTILSATFYYRF